MAAPSRPAVAPKPTTIDAAPTTTDGPRPRMRPERRQGDADVDEAQAPSRRSTEERPLTSVRDRIAGTDGRYEVRG